MQYAGAMPAGSESIAGLKTGLKNSTKTCFATAAATAALLEVGGLGLARRARVRFLGALHCNTCTTKL